MALTDNEIYRDVPVHLREQLQQFRASHPYKHLSVDGAEWSYIFSGKERQAILILGGGLSTGESSWRTILKLENKYRIISPSYPPLGKVGQIADGLAAILDAEGIGRPHVYGHSLGALIGHVFVRRHPDRVDKLILSSFGIYTQGHALAVRLFFKLPLPLLRAYYERALKRLTKGANGDEQIFLAAYMKDLFYLQHTPRTFKAQMGLMVDAFSHRDEYGILSEVQRPGRVLIIVASDDRGFSRFEQDILVATYPGARVKRFESGGHWVGLTHRAEYDEAINTFLQT